MKQQFDLDRAAEAESFRALAVRANAVSRPVTVARKGLSKSEMAAVIAEKNALTKKQAVEVLETICELAYKHAKDTFTLPGLGKLVLVNRAARVGRSPSTGDQIRIPAKRVVKFRVSKAAQDAILGVK